MNTRKRFLSKFTLFDLVVVSLVGSLGVAVKPLIVPLIHIITGPLMLPGGALAGGFYMLWLVMGRGIVKKWGTGTLIGLVQGIIVIILGVYGTHGIMSIITYTLPGIAVDIIFLLIKKEELALVSFFLAGLAANITGTYLTSLIFFRLPILPLLLGLSVAALSGGLGGIIALKITEQLKKYNLIPNIQQKG